MIIIMVVFDIDNLHNKISMNCVCNYFFWKLINFIVIK